MIQQCEGKGLEVQEKCRGRTAGVLADLAVLVGLMDRFSQHDGLVEVLATDVDVRRTRTHGVA
jgi:hypothetical protein